MEELGGMKDPRPALLALATSIAQEAGALLLDKLRGDRIAVITKSTKTDMVSEVDLLSEKLLLTRILTARPHDEVFAEEGTRTVGTSGIRWVLDPLDGTTNYLYGFPAFSVSIGVQIQGVPAIGVVHDPLHAETFSAARAGGAFCNGVPIEVSTVTDLGSALVGTGFSYRSDQRAWQAAAVSHLLPRIRDIRRAGSAALDLCWVACGRLDATYERGLQPWDHAAGALIATEAGAVADVEADSSWPRVVSSAPGIAAALFDLVADAEAAAGAKPA